MSEKLPFKIRSLSRGAQKARRRMQHQYGTEKGNEVWRKQAEERGQGKTLRQKVNSIYKRGGKKT